MVVEWFIPFLSLYRPLHRMRELWANTDPALNPIDSHEGESGDERRPWSTMMIDVWWGVWLLSNFADRALTRLDPSALEEYFLYDFLPLHLLSAVLWTVGAFFVIKIVGRITTAQYDRLARMPHIETQPVQRQQWGLISALLVPVSWGFAAIWALARYLELSEAIGVVSAIFLSFAVLGGVACGLRAVWNNCPRPATGVVGLFLGLLTVPIGAIGFAFLSVVGS